MDKTFTAKLFHNLCQVDPQGSAWHPPFYREDLPLSGHSLKWIAAITMLLDHIGAALLLFVFRANGRSEPLSTLYELLRDVGRIAFPIYIFLLVEGAGHSKSIPKYLLRLLLFALLSEIPFDLAFYGKVFYWKKQNVYFTLLIALTVIWGIHSVRTLSALYLKKTIAAIYSGLCAFGLILAGSLAAMALHTDYNFVGILAICAMYLLRMHPLAGCAASSLVLLLSSGREIFALAALLPVSLYNGKRGRYTKWFFYLFYPLHLLLLWGIRMLFQF